MLSRFSVARGCCVEDQPDVCDQNHWPFDGGKPDIIHISVVGEGSWSPAICFGNNDCSGELTFAQGLAPTSTSDGICSIPYRQFAAFGSGCYTVTAVGFGTLAFGYPLIPEGGELGRYTARLTLQFTESQIGVHQSISFEATIEDGVGANVDGLTMGPGVISNPNPSLGGCTNVMATISIP